MISQIVIHYLSRFKWEIAAFWLVSLASGIAVASDASARLISFLAMMEIIGIAWITIRLVLAEDGFQMSGGWRARPVSRVAQHLVPMLLAFGVILLPTLVRVVRFRRLFEVDSATWRQHWMDATFPQVIAWVAAAVSLKLFGLLVLRGAGGRARTAAWSVLALILLPVTGMICRQFGHDHRASASGGSPRNPKALAEGIKRQLPDSADLIGMWNEPPGTEDLPEARVILKLSAGREDSSPNVRVRSMECAIKGGRIVVTARVLDLDPAAAARMEDAIAILRYPDDRYGTCMESRLIHRGARTPWVPASEWEFYGDFFSPLSLPEFEGDPAELLNGLELWFFAEDLSKPTFPAGRSTLRVGHPEADSPPFRPADLTDLFARHPWSDEIWKTVARPFLLLHARESDVPYLLDRLEFDTRLMNIFIERGWTAMAMPTLRRLAKERIPMGLQSIEALAREKDPSLNDDLRILALAHTQGLAKLEAALRPLPGFDWPAFALEAWRRQKYSNSWLEPRGEFWIIAVWAAREGDFSAFRHTAEQAARGKPWELDQLKGLVAGDPPDLIAYLREHLDAMTFDPVTRKWGR